MGVAMHTDERDLYLICSKMQYREPGCIVWFYYACSFTPGAILSTAKLGIGSGDKAMNLAVLCGDFQTFFFSA